jgi:hypothetical protein
MMIFGHVLEALEASLITIKNITQQERCDVAD